MSSNDIILERINNLNKLLCEVYKNDKKISDILTEEGFTKPELFEMKSLLGVFMDKAITMLADRYKERHDCERLTDILIKRYGLLDGNINTLEQVGIEYGISRERVRQLQEKGLKRVKIYLRKIVVDSACLALGKMVADRVELKFNSENKIYLTRVMMLLGLSKAYPWVRSTQVANELYNCGYLEAKIHAGKLQFFPSEKRFEIGFRSAASEKYSRVYLEENAQIFIANFVREKFGVR